MFQSDSRLGLGVDYTSKNATIEFLLQEYEFTVYEDGYFSGSAQFQLANLLGEGVVAQAYLKMLVWWLFKSGVIWPLFGLFVLLFLAIIAANYQ